MKRIILLVFAFIIVLLSVAKSPFKVQIDRKSFSIKQASAIFLEQGTLDLDELYQTIKIYSVPLSLFLLRTAVVGSFFHKILFSSLQINAP